MFAVRLGGQVEKIRTRKEIGRREVRRGAELGCLRDFSDSKSLRESRAATGLSGLLGVHAWMGADIAHDGIVEVKKAAVTSLKGERKEEWNQFFYWLERRV